VPDSDWKPRLRELHEKLTEARIEDPDTRALLEDLRRDIDGLLAGPASADPGGVLDRMRQAVREFEDGHPSLTASLEEVIEALHRMGL
jgi:hypothetical protein